MADVEHHHTSLWSLRFQGLSVAVIILALCHCVAGHSLDNSVRITVEEQRAALLNLRQALGNPPQLVGWTGSGPCVDGKPVWFGITACSVDNLVQSVDLSVVTVAPSAPLLLGPTEVADAPNTVQPPKPQAKSTTTEPILQPSEGEPSREQDVSSGLTPSLGPAKPPSGKEKKHNRKKVHIVATAFSDANLNPIPHVHNETALDLPGAMPPSSEQLDTVPCQENNKGNKQETDPRMVGVLGDVGNEDSSKSTTAPRENQSKTGGQVGVRKQKGSEVFSGKDVDRPEKKVKRKVEKRREEKESNVNGNREDKIVKNKEIKEGLKSIGKGRGRLGRKGNVASGERIEPKTLVQTEATTDSEKELAPGRGPQTNRSKLDRVPDVDFGDAVNGVPTSTLGQAPNPETSQEISDMSQEAMPEISPSTDLGELEETLGSVSFPVEAPLDIAEQALSPLESPDSEEEGREILDVDSDVSGSDLTPLGAPGFEEPLTPQTGITRTGTAGGPSISPTSGEGLAGESSLPEFSPQIPTCVDNVIRIGNRTSERCDLCECLDDPTSDACIREASITCVDGGENPLTCLALNGVFRSLRVPEIQAAALIFQNRCEGLDNPNADFCSCTRDFESTECKAGWLQLCETNTEICALAFTAVSEFSQRQVFVDTLIDEGACEVDSRMVVFTLELGGISSLDFTPAVSERIRSITAAIAGADVSSVRVAAIGDVEFPSGQRRLLQGRNGVEVIVLIQAGSSAEAQMYNGRVEEARKAGEIEKELSAAGFELVSARVRDLDPRQSTTSLQKVSASGIPEENVASNQGGGGLGWWKILLIVIGTIAATCVCIFWMMVSARKRFATAINRSKPQSRPPRREQSREPSQDLRSKPRNPGSSAEHSSAAEISRLRAVPQEEILPNPFPTPRSARRCSHEKRKRSSDMSPRLPPIQSSGLPSPSRVVPPRPPSHCSRLTADMDSDPTDYEALAVAHKKAMREAATLMSDWVTAFDNMPEASDRDMYTETFSNILFDASYGSSEGLRPRSPPMQDQTLP